MDVGLQLICHAVGDYVLQNHTMAVRKTASWFWTAIHATLYTVPFVIVFGFSWAIPIIGVTHAVIDRYRLANLWVHFWGTGCEGWVMRQFRARRPRKINETQPLEMDAPPWLSVWLMIIVDNVFHVIINAVSLHHLGVV